MGGNCMTDSCVKRSNASPTKPSTDGIRNPYLAKELGKVVLHDRFS